MREVAGPGNRQPAQEHAEQVDQQQAEPEIGDRLPEYGDRKRRPVDPGVHSHGGEHAERNGDQERQGEGIKGQSDGDADALEYEFRDRFVGEQRLSEIAAERLSGPIEVLRVQGAVETVEPGDLGHLLGRRVLAGQVGREVAREPQ